MQINNWKPGDRSNTNCRAKAVYGIILLFTALITLLYVDQSGNVNTRLSILRIVHKQDISRYSAPSPQSFGHPLLAPSKTGLGQLVTNETKTTVVVPECQIFLTKLTTDLAKWQFLSYYDPGNCKDVTNLNILVKRTKDSQINEVRSLADKYSNELWERCQALKSSLSPDQPWRLCGTLPSPFSFGQWQVQRYEYDNALHAKAMEEVGEDCFNRPLAVYFDPKAGNHPGGPRKVVNAFLSGMRLIQKPYAYMDWDISSYDLKYQSCPYNNGLLYNLSYEEANGWFLGPTVVHTQFVNSYLTPGAREKVHITAASLTALKTSQYFPRIHMNQSEAVVIPTGVDTQTFKPNTPFQRKNKVFMSYRKHGCQRDVLAKLEAVAKQAGYQIREINYGSYNEDTFLSTLEQCKFVIFCDGTETQGLAGEEILAMDVPMFVTDKNSVPYFSNACGYIMNGTQDESTHLELRTFLEKVEKGAYSPRKWIKEHLSYYKAAVSYLRTMCGKVTDWWPPKNQ